LKRIGEAASCSISIHSSFLTIRATFGDFFDQPKVADAVSDLFRDAFGIQKTSVRVVIGVASLPLGVPIGLDVIFEVAELQRFFLRRLDGDQHPSEQTDTHMFSLKE
jgi:hypothetical protein